MICPPCAAEADTGSYVHGADTCRDANQDQPGCTCQHGVELIDRALELLR